MWTCPTCGEKIEDQFQSCWKCAGGSSQETPAAKKRPLEQLELICIVVAAMPGILMLTGGPIQNRAQAVFRVSIFVVGLLGYIAVKIYRHKKPRGES
jgi:hypothetical protein